MTDNLKTVTAQGLAWMLAAYVNRAITLEEVRQLQLVKKNAAVPTQSAFCKEPENLSDAVKVS